MNSTVQKMNSLMPVAAANKVSDTVNLINTSNPGTMSPGGNIGAMVFVSFLVIFLIIFAFYYDMFISSIGDWIESIKTWYTGNGEPAAEKEPAPPVMEPTPPQDVKMDSEKEAGFNRVVERILPPAKEIFTVSKNVHTYYDAAPLCKALGAELATYDEVKNAWQQGADWCNYGWIKGQMAVYPTQESSYQELQEGPPEQRGACGRPGVNGGYFDNPEMKFGVTCSGKRPSQSNHDATVVTSGATRALTASGLEFEKKVQEFKAQSDSMGVLPFNKSKWSS
jgi:hypothetical protein